MAFSDDILVEEHNFTRTITLNRPRKLNAVTPQMLSHLHQLYSSYKLNPNVKLIIVKGNGKAFCAGGDFSSLVQKVSQGKSHWSLPAKFFYDEFSLNHKIATHSKPQISILNGIVIGTGAGISMHGMFRVVTENTMFSLPETALGISPNAGGSFFLPRLPGFFGEYLGLTGARLDGAEMLACGLATHFVHSSKLDSLEEALIQVNTSDPRVLTLIIEEFSCRPSLKENSAYNSLHIINKCFSKGTVEEILYALETEHVKSDWIFAAVQTMKKVSPIGMKVSLSSIRRGRWQTVGECLVREYRIMAHALRRDVSNDFFEGCRAIFIEKDRKPKWEPSVLEVISEEMVENYFSKVDDVGEYLELFGRPELPAYAVAKL